MEVKLSCECGLVRGKVVDYSPQNANRIYCYCKDCRRFPEVLGVSDRVVDSDGGTEIIQVPMNSVHVEQGMDQIRCLHLKEGGLFRWYSECCKTPLGNTLDGKMPFFGIIHSFLEPMDMKESALGPVMGLVHTQSALNPPKQKKHYKGKFSILFTVVSRLLKWKYQKLHQPSCFFEANGLPVVKPEIKAGPIQS